MEVRPGNIKPTFLLSYTGPDLSEPSPAMSVVGASI